MKFGRKVGFWLGKSSLKFEVDSCSVVDIHTGYCKKFWMDADEILTVDTVLRMM